jgi:hypothetical protein
MQQKTTYILGCLFWSALMIIALSFASLNIKELIRYIKLLGESAEDSTIFCFLVASIAGTFGFGYCICGLESNLQRLFPKTK